MGIFILNIIISRSISDDKTAAEVARELDLVPQRLQKWVAKYKKDQEDSFVETGNRRPKDQVAYKKDKRTGDLKEEIAILKKAMGIFAKK